MESFIDRFTVMFVHLKQALNYHLKKIPVTFFHTVHIYKYSRVPFKLSNLHQTICFAVVFVVSTFLTVFINIYSSVILFANQYKRISLAFLFNLEVSIYIYISEHERNGLG